MNIFKKIYGLLDFIKYAVLYEGASFLALFMKKNPKYKDLWLISERKTDARDNGYHFFQIYVRKSQ